MNNSLVSMGRLKPGLWAMAILFICVFLLRAAMRASELYISPHPIAEEFDKWITVTVDFTTGQEVPRSYNVSDAIALEVVRFENVLPISKAVFSFECIWLAVCFAVHWVVFAVGFTVRWVVIVVVFAVGLGTMVTLLRRVDWPAVYRVVVGALRWILHWAADVVYVVALELGGYLAQVGKDLKRDFARGLVRASENFPVPKRVLGKTLEWVAPVENTDFKGLGNLLSWVEECLEPVKRYLLERPIRISEIWLTPLEESILLHQDLVADLDEKDTLPEGQNIHHTSLSEDHKTPKLPKAVTEEVEYEDDEIWVEDVEPAVKLDLVLASPLEHPEIQAIKPGLIQGVLEQEAIQVFRRRPWSRQTIFTANSSKDIEGLPLYIYPPKPKWFWRWKAEVELRKFLKRYPVRVKVVKYYRVTRMPCRHVTVIPHLRHGTRGGTSSAQQAIPLAPGPAVDQSVSEFYGEIEEFSSCDEKLVDVPVVVDEAQACIEPAIEKGKEEHQPQVFTQEEGVFRQTDRQAMALTSEPESGVDTNEAYENIPAVGLATGQLGDVPMVTMDAVGSLNVPVTVEEVRASLRPAIAEEEKEYPPQESMQHEAEIQQPDPASPSLTHKLAQKADINHVYENIQGVGFATGTSGDVPIVTVDAIGSCNVAVIVEEAQMSIGPAIAEEEKTEYSPQESMQHEAEIQQLDPAAPSLTHEPVQKVNINQVYENIQGVSFATGTSGDVPMVTADAVGSRNVPVIVEEAQMSLGSDIAEEEKTEYLPRESMQNEAESQQADRAVPEMTHELAPKENINDAWTNLQGIGLATGPLGDVPMVEANIPDSWNVPATVEDDAQMSLEPDIAQEAKGLVDYSSAEGSEMSLEPDIAEEAEELMDYSTAEGSVPPAAALDDEQVPEANLDTLWAELLGAGLVTGRSGDAPQVDKSVTDPWGVPATAEKAWVSPRQTIERESEAVVRPAIVEGPGERCSQTLGQEEVTQPADLQAMELTHEPVPMPEVNIHELCANVLAAGLVTEPLGGAPNVAMNIIDPRDVLAIVGEVQTLLAPATSGESQGYHPQVLLQQEGVIHQMGSPAIVPSKGTVPQLRLAERLANLVSTGRVVEQLRNVQRVEVPGLDSTYSQRRSPPYENPIAELTRYLVTGSGNGGSAPGALTLPTQEQASGSSLQGGVKTEGVGSVKFRGKVAPAFLFGDGSDTEEEIPPPVTDTFNSMPSGRQRGETSATMPSTRVYRGPFRFTKFGGETSGSETDEEEKIYWADSMPEKLRTLHGHYSQAAEAQTSSDSETDEEEKIYWADNMPEKLRTLHGHYSRAPEAQALKECRSISEDSSSGTSFSELYELFNKECENNEEAKEDKQVPDREAKEDKQVPDGEAKEDNQVSDGEAKEDKQVLDGEAKEDKQVPDGQASDEEMNDGSSDEVKGSGSMPAHLSALLDDDEDEKDDYGYGRQFQDEDEDEEDDYRHGRQFQDDDEDEEDDYRYGRQFQDHDEDEYGWEYDYEEGTGWEPSMPERRACSNPPVARKELEGATGEVFELDNFLLAAMASAEERVEREREEKRQEAKKKKKELASRGEGLGDSRGGELISG